RPQTRDSGVRHLRCNAEDRGSLRFVFDRRRSAAPGAGLRPAPPPLRRERSAPPAGAYAADRDVVEGKLCADAALLPAQRLRRDLAHQGLLSHRVRQNRLLQEIRVMSPNLTLYLALGLYAAGTLVALASLFVGKRLQTPGLVL